MQTVFRSRESINKYQIAVKIITSMLQPLGVDPREGESIMKKITIHQPCITNHRTESSKSVREVIKTRIKGRLLVPRQNYVIIIHSVGVELAHQMHMHCGEFGGTVFYDYITTNCVHSSNQ